jgi:HEAT repeat protein
MGARAPAAAKRLLDEMLPKNPELAKAAAAEAAKLIDVNAELATLKGDGNWTVKGPALKNLALAAPDPALRDAVAGTLEQILLSDNSTFLYDDAAAALQVWMRPQTVPALLPLLDEKVWPPSRRSSAIKLLAKTKDKRAVYPIVRWIIKAPDEVVPALKEMGPVAEDEVIKLLREKDPTVRTNAARILDEIGTNKSIVELRRESRDTRDVAAAAAAKSAMETVTARVKATPATTRATTKATS